MFSSEAMLNNLKRTLSILDETKHSYKIETNHQETKEKKLLALIK